MSSLLATIVLPEIAISIIDFATAMFARITAASHVIFVSGFSLAIMFKYWKYIRILMLGLAIKRKLNR